MERPQASQRVDPSDVASWTWLLPGSPLAEEPEQAGTALASMAYLPVLHSREVWQEVLYRGRRRWFDTSWEPALDGSKRRRLPVGVFPQSSDPSLLRRARTILGAESRTLTLGPYRLLTDVDDNELLAFLDRTAGKVEQAYVARYGLSPAGKPRHTIVLFAGEEDYRTYSSAGDEDAPDWRVGHARGGMAIFFRGERSRVDLTRTLVHELTHLLNHRALAPLLPPWLEEGLASDLGYVWVEDLTGSPMSAEAARQQEFVIRGAEISVLMLNEALEGQHLPRVAALLGLDRETFRRDGLHRFAYAQSVMLVRYLLDEPGDGFASGFRDYLTAVARGQPPSMVLLSRVLDVSMTELDEGFRSWVREEAAALHTREAARLRGGSSVSSNSSYFEGAGSSR